MARHVEDLELLFFIMSGIKAPARSGRAKQISSLEGKCIGWSPYYFRNLSTEVESAVAAAIKVFQESGAEIVEVDIPILDEALYASDIISRSEAVAVHDSLLQNEPKNYGPMVKERLETGYSVSGKELALALRSRLETRKQFSSAFDKVTALIAPTLPVTAPRLGTLEIEFQTFSEPIVQSFVRLNSPQNVAGIPVLALPCGFSDSGLPIGMQLIGPESGEGELFKLGAFYQARTDWHRRVPPLLDQ